LADTWTFDGTNWTLALPLTSPPSRQGHAMAWDPLGQRVVLFGGRRLLLLLADTWTFDGADWTPQVLTPHPAARQRAAFAAATGGAPVLFGGSDAAGPRGDTWTLVQNRWFAGPAAGPPARTGAVLLPAAGGVLLAAGADAQGPRTDSWLFAAS